MNFDIVIYNGTIITVNPGFDIIRDGVVGIKNGKLEQIGSFSDGFAIPAAKARREPHSRIITSIY